MPDVLFRGPMLVFPQSNNISIRIPDAMRLVKHPDGDSSRQHFAGLFVATLPEGEVPEDLSVDQRESLMGTRVTISDGTDVDTDWDASLNDMIDLQEHASVGKTGVLTPLADDSNFFKHGAAIVTFKGGLLSAEKPTNLTYTIPGAFSRSGHSKSQQIPMLVRWTPKKWESTGVTIDIVDAGGVRPTIELASEQTACVYNWDGDPDVGKPTPREFMNFKPAICSGPAHDLVDTDFKWLYELLTPPNGDWKSWLDKRMLTAPVSPCAKATPSIEEVTTAPNKDCLPGRWGR